MVPVQNALVRYKIVLFVIVPIIIHAPFANKVFMHPV